MWYRLYVRDRVGHFGGVREFEALDEAQAIQRVERMCEGMTCELWQEQRLLRQWNGVAPDHPLNRTLPDPYSRN
jgi:hypothetical protein